MVPFDEAAASLLRLFEGATEEMASARGTARRPDAHRALRLRRTTPTPVQAGRPRESSSQGTTSDV